MSLSGGYTFERCDDGHHCENGSVCTQDPLREGSWMCDCDEGRMNGKYAGLFCEHKATVECSDPEAVSGASFCTNGGTCKVVVSTEYAYLECNCPKEYTGEHCQFVKNKKVLPEDGGGYGDGMRSDESGQNQTIYVFFVVLMVALVTVVVALAFFFMIRRRAEKGKDKMLPETSKNLVVDPAASIDADGEVLKQAMSHALSPSSGVFDDADLELVDAREVQGMD